MACEEPPHVEDFVVASERPREVDPDRDGGGDADGDADDDERACGDGLLCPEPQERDLGLCVDPGEPAWRIHAGVTGEDLHAVTARADGRVLAVGEGGRAFEYHGPEQGWRPSWTGTDRTLRGVWVGRGPLGEPMVFAVGDAGTVLELVE